MLKPLLLIVVLVITGSNVSAQTIQAGFRFEPAFTLTNVNSENEVNFSPYSLYASIKGNISERISLEVRPGYFMGEENYGGPELGGFFHYRVIDGWKILLGYNYHSNTWLGGSNNRGGYSKKINHTAVGLLYQKDSKLSFDITYFIPHDRVFGYSNHIDSMGKSVLSEKKVNGIIKLGFSIMWDIY
jgi:hypothetical protein